MIIAATYKDGEIFGHFGHTEQFKIYQVENKEIVSARIINTNGNGHGALAAFLSNLKADVLICGGIGSGAQKTISDAGILLFGGVQGQADKAVEDFILGKLAYNPNIQCDHHDHANEEGHNCGNHSCR